MEASLRGGAIFALEKLGVEIPEAPLRKAVKPRGKYAKLYAAERERERELEKHVR